MTTNACCVWDLTINCDHVTFVELSEWMEEHCKKWCFQKEEGEGGYIHYQCRVSLKVKTRNPSKIGLKNFWFSVTSKENMDNDFYASKPERLDGPWKDTDEKIYIPRQIREIKKLWPWQQYIVDHSKDWDTRTINVIIDKKGCSGKSTLKGYMRAYKLARPVPFANDYKDIMRMIMDIPTSTCYLIDMPRAINKERLFQFFAGVESIKDGYAYDDRYKFQEKFFDCPNIWIFTNAVPDRESLSQDRWVLWEIVDQKLNYYPTQEEDF